MIKRFFVLLLFTACLSLNSQTTEVVFVQLNDVYEISPLEGGKYGGLARVATLVKELKAKNPYTYVILSGDFISPSALGTSEYEGKRINGRQMVELLNAVGLDFVTFGNHEFDYKYEVLQERINESGFEWINSNVHHISMQDTVNGLKTPRRFYKSVNGTQTDLPEYKILSVPGNRKNTQIKLGLLGVCLDANKQSYVMYENYIHASKRVYNSIKDSINYLVGITHLSIDEDKILAESLPELRLSMGGHEHVNMYHKAGNTIIAKADANARTVYVHTLIFDENNNLSEIKSVLTVMDSSVAEDPEVKDLADEWTARAFKGFMDKGFDPLVLVYDLKNEVLDGREETVRYKQNPLGYLIANSMYDAAPGSDLAFFNSGAIRIDDELRGEVTQYDIIRVLPFGGKILRVELYGSLLKQILETGLNNSGSGGYLQFYGAEYTAQGWKVKSAEFDDSKVYKAAVSDYLLSGMEQNFGYLTKDNPGIVKITVPDAADKNDLCNDVRFAVIKFFEKWNR